MRIYYLEDENGRPGFSQGVDDISKIPDLIKRLSIGAARVINIKVNTSTDEFQPGYGSVEFNYQGDNYYWRISSLEIK